VRKKNVQVDRATMAVSRRVSNGSGRRGVR
jgi:hypothetical protein